jgi:hypothetical protein
MITEIAWICGWGLLLGGSFCRLSLAIGALSKSLDTDYEISPEAWNRAI